MIRQSTALAVSRSESDSGTPEVSDDARLAARCRAGDAVAWKELYDAHFDFVFRVARRLGIPADDAEDVVHDVFVVAHRRLDQFREGRMSTWLYRITANIVSDRHRSRRVRDSLDIVRTWFWGATVPTPEDIADKRSNGRAIERILGRMSPKKREVFALFELDGLSGEEIAEHVGCPVGTVWTRLHHARRDFVRLARKMGCLEVIT